MTRIAPFVLVTTLLAAPAGAQTLQPPPHWQWITDGPVRMVSDLDVPEGALLFATMAPGWHITTRVGALFNDPRYFTEGAFSLDAEVFLFPDSGEEEYGVFVGGTALESPQRRYAAFVLRRDRTVGLFVVDGSSRTTVVPWTPHPAALTPGTEAVRNHFSIAADADSVHVGVNGVPVAHLARNALPVEGAFGFRVGPGMNLHAIRLDVSHRLAPTPLRKP